MPQGSSLPVSSVFAAQLLLRPLERAMLHRFAVLAVASIGIAWSLPALAADPPPRCEPGDRLPACRSDPAECLAALKASPQGDPVQLACSAEAGCLAGKAPACGPLLQFLAIDGFGRDLAARSAEFEAACGAGQKGACQVMAVLLEKRLKSATAEQSPGLKLRMVRAATKACSQGLDCARVVALVDAGGAGATADEEAGAALEAACKGNGDAAACAWVAKTYGDLGQADSRLAKCQAKVARACAAHAAEQKLAGADPDPWLAQACDAGDCGSCVLRLRDDKGRLKVAGDHANAAVARSVCANACAAGRMSACNLSHDLMMAGVGGGRDEAAAVKQRLPMCRLDDNACVPLARAWLVTPSLPEDDDVAAALAQVCKTKRDYAIRVPACLAPGVRTALRAERVNCAGGDDATCVSLGRRLRDLSLHAQAADVLAPACDRGRVDACAALLQVRFMGLDLPPLASAAAAKIKATAQKACDGADAVACFEVSQAEEGQGSGHAKKAMQLLGAACKQGNGAACRMAGDLCEGYGRKLAEDPKKAMALRESGCKAGDALACLAAGRQADEDSENPASGEVSGPLYLRACTLGEAQGCTRLQSTQPQPAGTAEALAAACKRGAIEVCPR